MAEHLYDTIVIGGGPAGAAAAVYTARKKMKTLVITKEFGGQSSVSSGIENWLGEKTITGMDLAGKIESHVRAQQALEVVTYEKVESIKEVSDCLFEVTTDRGNSHRTKTVIIASGSRRKYLGVPGEQKFNGRGVAFCATCDAPFFQDQDVAVVGSGNSALETVIDLLSYAKQVYLLCRDPIQADPVTEERVRQSEKTTIIQGVQIEDIVGDETVTGLHYREMESGETKELTVGGVFVEIGMIPNSEFVGGLVTTNKDGEIIVDCKSAATSKKGIFAAGDVTTDPFKQNNIAAGDGVRAALSAYYYLLDIRKHSPCAQRWEE